MKLSEQVLLEFRMRLEELISEREAMIAENLHGEYCGHAQAYGSDSFFINMEAIKACRNDLVALGEK